MHAEGRSSKIPASVWAGMISIYIVWGSTYLAIRFAVETIPPFLMAGTRNFLAGGARDRAVHRHLRHAAISLRHGRRPPRDRDRSLGGREPPDLRPRHPVAGRVPLADTARAAKRRPRQRTLLLGALRRVRRFPGSG